MFLLLQIVILVKIENLIKGTQSYEYNVSLIFKDKMQVPVTLFIFNYPRLSMRASPYFLCKKYMALSNIRNCMFKRDMEFRPF